MQIEKNINKSIKSKKNIIAAFALTAVLLVLETRAGDIYTQQNNSADSIRNSIIFISDTQTPMGFEKLFVKTHRNKEATKILLDKIAGDSSVSSVFMLGDITAMSSFDNNWTVIDTFLSCLKAKHIHAYATAGNHDYLLTSGSGESNLIKRFPTFRRTGYTIRMKYFAVVLLNSNFSELDDWEKKQQLEWYLNELNAMDQDSTIKFIAVGCHHSPYSNSNIVGYDRQVRSIFVPPFIKSKKCRVFISGHAHTFQYFKDTVEDKHFLVIGGGGGLLHRLKPGKPNDLQDRIEWKDEYRMFHFIKGIPKPNGFDFTVMMLEENLSGPRPVFELHISYQN